MTQTATPPAPPVNLFMATFNTDPLHQWMTRTDTKDKDQAVHRILLETFGPLTPRPHRLILPKFKSKHPTIYGYTQADAPQLRAKAQACANPLQSTIIPANTILTKPMPTNWHTGEKFAFDMRIRPIVRFSSPRHSPSEAPGASIPQPPAPHGEADVYIQDVISRRNNNLTARDMTTVYAEWLAALFDRQGGASLDRNSVTLQSFRKTPKSHKNPTSSQGPDAVLYGNLTVGNPVAFANLIANGAGRHKAYGYGMVIIRAVLN